jgi:hypothetical protein
MTNYPAHVRFTGGIPSNLIVLDEIRQSTTAMGRPQTCWTTSISPYLAVVATAKQVRRGQPVHLQLAEIGSVRGYVARFLEGGLAMNLELSDADRSELTGKIAWYQRRLIDSAPDRREYKRRPPADPDSVLLLADGATAPCEIIDVSRSGATIAAAIQPEVGVHLAIGQAVARVMRHIGDTGFAVQFLVVQDEDKLDQMVHPMPMRLA